MRSRLWIIPVLLAVAFGGVVHADVPAGAQSPTSKSTPQKPNIVYVHTDDLSANLAPHMSAVRAMSKRGTTFSNHFVASSLCCPSRAAMLTGRYPHNTKVLTNKNLDRGGNRAFVANGNEKHTYAVALDKAGYRTGLFGKYLNGFNIRRSPVPAGWDEWHIGGGRTAYSNVAGSYEITNVLHKGDTRKVSKPKRYLTDLLGERARAFVDRARDRDQPFFLQLSTFAPHARIGGDRSEPRFPPAPRDRPGGQFKGGDCGVHDGVRTKCGSLKVGRGVGFGKRTYRKLDRELRDRVRMVQSLNDQMIKLRRHLTAREHRNTYFVFSSDNGFHLGDHGLLRGKRSAYDHDVRTPLIVTGPGVPKGATRRELVQNIDLYGTFRLIAGMKPARHDGHSLLGLMRGKDPADWREAVLIAHTAVNPEVPGLDPDDDRRGAVTAGPRINPGGYTYQALRTKRWLYVKYTDQPWRELYDLRADPGQNTNVHASHRKLVRDTLEPRLRVLSSCGGSGVPCWQAGQLDAAAQRLHPSAKGENASDGPSRHKVKENAVSGGDRNAGGAGARAESSAGLPLTGAGLLGTLGVSLLLVMVGAATLLLFRRRGALWWRPKRSQTPDV